MREFTNLEDMSKILKALQRDWMLVDDFPDKDFFVLVNMGREVMENYHPMKELIIDMERQGLIKNYDNLSEPQPKTYSYFITYSDGRVEEVARHNPHVYYYKLTKKGKDFLASHKNL